MDKREPGLALPNDSSWGETSDPAVAEFAKDKFGEMIAAMKLDVLQKSIIKKWKAA